METISVSRNNNNLFEFLGINQNVKSEILQSLVSSNQSLDSQDNDGNTALMLGNSFHFIFFFNLF